VADRDRQKGQQESQTGDDLRAVAQGVPHQQHSADDITHQHFSGRSQGPKLISEKEGDAENRITMPSLLSQLVPSASSRSRADFDSRAFEDADLLVMLNEGSRTDGGGGEGGGGGPAGSVTGSEVRGGGAEGGADFAGSIGGSDGLGKGAVESAGLGWTPGDSFESAGAFALLAGRS
jgi:hypothetical protein